MKIAIFLVATAFLALTNAAPQQPQRVMLETVPMMKLTKALKIQKSTDGGFSFSNCAVGSNLNIKTLTVDPSPIVIPGSATVSLDASIKTEIVTISSVDLVVKKKGVWCFHWNSMC